MKQVVVKWGGAGFPGEGDGRWDGRYAVCVPNKGVVTDTGTVALPGESLRYVRLANNGPRWAAFGQDSGYVYEFDGLKLNKLPNKICGLNPVIYDKDNKLVTVPKCVPPTGAMGWRYVNEAGDLVTSDSTYRHPSGLIYQYTSFSDVLIGQDVNAGLAVWFPGEAKPRILTNADLASTDDSQIVRVSRNGDQFSISTTCYKQGKTVITWVTLAELKALKGGGEVVEPLPETTIGSGIHAHPRKMWVAPFFSFGKYGDTPVGDFLEYGNAATLVGNDADPAVFPAEVERVYKTGLPIIAKENVGPDHIGSVIAWWASGANLDGLGAEVNEALKRAPKPVIAYLDKGANGWPAAKPAWVTAQVWPSVQAYRVAGESLAAFKSRVEAQLKAVAGYGNYITLTPRFDDFNGSSTIAEIEECMPLYSEWIQNFPIACVMPFADRRGNGIAKVGSLKAWATAFNRANPARPNRFDYWTPPGDPKVALRNKLGQTTELVVLSPQEKAFLLKVLA